MRDWGRGRRRLRIVDTLRRQGGPATSIGRSSVVHPTVRTENLDIVVGEKCRLRRDVFIRGPQVRIGDRVFLNDGVYVNHHVTIEDDVSIGQFCRLITGGHELGPPEHRAGPTTTMPIVIESGVWLGAGVTVLPGVRIGAGAVVASGSVVREDCLPNHLYAGVPARRKRAL